MGTVVGTVEDCREMFEGSVETSITPCSSTNQIGNPVAYKLVRVAGDGRLVPATDEEILEVNETDMHIATDAGQIPAEELPSQLSQLESSEAINSGLLQSDNVEPCTDQVKSQPEYNEEMLPTVEQEERLDMIHESQMSSTPADANVDFPIENKLLDEDQVHHEALLQEPIPYSSNVQNGCDMNQSDKTEPCSDAAASPKETALPVPAQKPDFSLVRGEICLDNLTIKLLQETFRATFGRETTVKDKTWLKRRITMGLVNSCDVPTTNLTIKDNKLVRNQEKSNDVTVVVTKDFGDVVRVTNPKDVNVHSNASSGRSLSGNHYRASEDFSPEQRAAKRARKPTRRYIEELSETDEKQPNDKSAIPSKDQRSPEKAEVRSISVSSGKRVAVTRLVSLAGSEIEVPYVSHVRRSRPRENFMSLMESHSNCLEGKASAAESNQNLSQSLLNSVVVNGDLLVESASGPVQKEFDTGHNNSEEHSLTEVDEDMEPEHIDSSGNSSDDYNNIGLPIMQGGGALRRKHHRAWALSEVTKLVEGVSKYGAGKWSEIKKFSFSSHSYRTSVDLKDKWRNLLKASFAPSPSNTMGSHKKHGSMHIPVQILLQVRELAEKQALVPPVSKVVGDGNRREKETRTDFL